MDAEQRLVWDAEVSAALLCNFTADDFELIDLDSTFNADALSARGLSWAGVIAFKAGGVTMALSDPSAISFEMMRRVSNEFARRLAGRISGVDWLERLYRLPDPRD